MGTNKRHRIRNYKDMVSSYYSVITEPYRHFWGDFFHPAIFEDLNDDIETALLKTRKRFIRDSKLKADDAAIDLGCGIGTLSCFIASDVGCKVVGINITDFQLRKARKLAKDKRMHNVEFKNQDIMEADSLGQKFDAAFLIDVGCHLPDKGKALRKIYKILNKGGRLVIADWLQKDSLSLLENELLIEPFNDYWNFPYMESLEGYKKLFTKTGFKIIKADDVSEETRKNWDAFYKIALEGVNTLNLKTIISHISNPSVLKQGKKSIQIAKNQFYANVFTKICFDAGVFKYGYFVVEK